MEQQHCLFYGVQINLDGAWEKSLVTYLLLFTLAAADFGFKVQISFGTTLAMV